MVRVKDLRDLLFGIDGEFEIELIDSVHVDYNAQTVRFVTIPYPTDKDFDFGDGERKKTERFFPNMVGIED